MQKVKEFFLKSGCFIKRHKAATILVTLAILIGGFFIWDSFSASGGVVPDITIKKKPKEERVRAPISGRLTTKDRTERKPMAVVIENHPDSRPQSGINKASLVYETFAEGGITRWLAIFQEEDVAEIGPVRSARNYFVEWALSFNALFAHVGGSSDALDLIIKYKVLDLNQFSLGKFFWRDSKRYSPHNVYTTTDKLREAARSKGYATEDSKIPSFMFKDDPKESDRPEALSFVVNFNSNFAVTWTYDKKGNQFLRSMAGKKQVDRVTGEQFAAKNIVIEFSEFSYGTTRTGEQSTKIRTTGTGKAIFYIDGKRTTGTWSRSGQTSAPRFFDDAGKEVVLNGGTTWVEVVPTGTVVQ